MYHRSLTRSPLTLTLILSLSFVFSAASCDSNKAYKKAAQAAYDLDLGIAATQQVVEGLNRTNPPTLSDEDYLAILEAERDLLMINREFRAQLSELRAITPQNAPVIILILDRVSQGVSNLSAQGFSRIKNEKLKTSFMTGLLLARSSIATLQIFLQNVKAPVELPPGAITQKGSQ